MRIGIEFIDLIPDRVGGVERYTWKLIEFLIKLAPEHEYRFYLRHAALGRLPKELHDRAFVADRRFPARLPFVVSSLGQWVTMTNDLERWKPDVFHNTMHFPRPAWAVRNRVVTVHDLLFEREPTAMGTATSKFMSWHCRMGARRAKCVIADSEFIKREVVELYGVSADRVHVVYLGVDTSEFCVPRSASDIADFRTRHGLPADYLYFPAATARNKNHVRLLRALRILRDEHRLDCPLVLTGLPNVGHTELFRTIADLGLTGRVFWLEHLPAADVVRCYQGASALVYPSTYEGFGLPPLEAMASGCPVACSSTTSVGEVVGDAAVTFDPTDPRAIAAGLRRVLGDDALRRSLRELGFARAATFTWERTARDTLAAYRRAAGR